MDNLEKEMLELILLDFCFQENVAKYINEIQLPIDHIDSDWKLYVPPRAKQRWNQMGFEDRCLILRLCLQIVDLETVVKNYKSSGT